MAVDVGQRGEIQLTKAAVDGTVSDNLTGGNPFGDGYIDDCRFKFKVFGGGIADNQNDFTSLLVELNDASDPYLMQLIRCNPDGTETVVGAGLDSVSGDDDTWGMPYDLGNISGYPLRIGYKWDWNMIFGLGAPSGGAGVYFIRTTITTLGSQSISETRCYDLKQFSFDLADKTVRIDWTQNGNIFSGIDYTGMNWEQSVRLKAIVREREVLEVDEYLDADRNLKQVQDQITYDYPFKTIGLIPIDVRKLLRDMILANDITLVDFNKSNNIEILTDIDARAKEIEDTEDYPNNSGKAFNCVFTKRQQNDIKRNF